MPTGSRPRSMDYVSCFLPVTGLERLMEEKRLLMRVGIIGKTVTVTTS
eukprot:IDg3003t1